MIMQDKLEKERNDAKNSVEEYVYDMRDKLSGLLEKFVCDEDRDSLTLKLEDTENWLYEDGEDQPKQVYLDKLAELKTLGQPILERYHEAEERPKAFDDLGKHIQQYLKVVDSFKNKDEQYLHLDAAEMDKVERFVMEAMEWMNSKMNQQNNSSLTVDPVIKVKEIQAKTKELYSACNSVVSKPKPKVEPPKEEQKETEHNGPVNGQESTENPPAEAPCNEKEKAPDQASQTSTENKLPEMDID
ncbi:heat shock 70 kDa protein 4-like [Polypterus senegalus]|uniref:heat shock 70 kDa protein 4-like n=1 Tax=Polypterus senegalus TaxID=55291 RepID=UPI00196237A5|nr:heat shock 70 kDa protein 4-like [Polypterus senegalus]